MNRNLLLQARPSTTLGVSSPRNLRFVSGAYL